MNNPILICLLHTLLSLNLEFQPQFLQSGNSFNCLNTPAAGTHCWGSNEFSQLGINALTHSRLVKHLSLGMNHICAIVADQKPQDVSFKDSGDLVANQNQNQSDDKSGGKYNFNYLTHVQNKIDDITYTHNSQVITTHDSNLVCTGDDSYSQTIPPSITIPSLHTIDVATKGNFTCALFKERSSKVCFGDNDHQQLYIPTTIQNRADMVKVKAGVRHACMQDANFIVQCWGDSRQGMLDLDYEIMRRYKVGEFELGDRHTCLSIENRVIWGYDKMDVDQQGGDFKKIQCIGSDDSNQLIPPKFDHDVRQITAGYQHNCLINESFNAHCWGFNYQGQINIDGAGKLAQSVSAGRMHTCLLHRDVVRCQGYNKNGQSDDQYHNSIEIERQISKLSSVKLLRQNILNGRSK